MEYKVNINGLDIEANFSQRSIDEILLPLLQRLTNMQKEKGSRVLVMVAAPPGAGKSTLVSFLEKLSKETEGITPIQAIGMDGFHMRQEYLVSHTTVRDGEEIPMVQIKGAPETFDLTGLMVRVSSVAKAEICGWPIYDRTLHNPVDNVITVDGDIVLLEGNYLLLNRQGWDELSKMADYTIFIKADEKLLRNRLIERKALSGNSTSDATSFVDFSDMVNVRTCLQESKPADLVINVEDL